MVSNRLSLQKPSATCLARARGFKRRTIQFPKPSQAKPSQAKPSQIKPTKPNQAKPSQAKVLTGGGDLRKAQAIPAFDRVAGLCNRHRNS